MRDGKVLILRRSQKVGTYRGKWAAVSGHLESGEKPLERALTEIREETGIERDWLVLAGIGPETPIAGTSFVVHPFMFELRNPASTVDPAWRKTTFDDVPFQLDWEHTESKWVDPPELSILDTVPQLAEVFEAAKNGGCRDH
jgi:8-oxo-dGTP pyrophosphatase MutT (NUDIX family)